MRVIQIDSDPLEMHTNVKATMPIVGDLKTVLFQLNQTLTDEPLCNSDGAWWREIRNQ